MWNHRLDGDDKQARSFLRVVIVALTLLVAFFLLKKDNITKGISVSLNKLNKLELEFHVIVAYGVSIAAVADNLMSNVKYKVEEFTGLEIEKINIYVEGVRVID